jgi:hypothetical protein
VLVIQTVTGPFSQITGGAITGRGTMTGAGHGGSRRTNRRCHGRVTIASRCSTWGRGGARTGPPIQTPGHRPRVPETERESPPRSPVVFPVSWSCPFLARSRSNHNFPDCGRATAPGPGLRVPPAAAGGPCGRRWGRPPTKGDVKARGNTFPLRSTARRQPSGVKTQEEKGQSTCAKSRGSRRGLRNGHRAAQVLPARPAARNFPDTGPGVGGAGRGRAAPGAPRQVLRYGWEAGAGLTTRISSM